MLEYVQILEHDKCETHRVLEMAELSYQMLSSKNERLQEDNIFYKSELKLQGEHFSTIANDTTDTIASMQLMEDRNVELEEKLKELKAQLEQEKNEKTTTILNLKSTITNLENDKGIHVEKVTSLLTNLQPSTMEEMSELRVEVTTKNRKIEALEGELKEFKEKTQILADELNRICDEVERSEHLYLRVETVTRENENLRQEVNYLNGDAETLKQELLTKEKEIATFVDDNDKMVAKLITLGIQVQVDEKNITNCVYSYSKSNKGE